MDTKADRIHVTPWFYGAKREEIEAAIAASKLSGQSASQELARIKKERVQAAHPAKDAPQSGGSSFNQGYWSAIVLVAVILIVARFLRWLF